MTSPEQLLTHNLECDLNFLYTIRKANRRIGFSLYIFANLVTPDTNC